MLRKVVSIRNLGRGSFRRYSSTKLAGDKIDFRGMANLGLRKRFRHRRRSEAA
jgi:hypothetical protein